MLIVLLNLLDFGIVILLVLMIVKSVGVVLVVKG